MFLNRVVKCRSLINSTRIIRRSFILPSTKDKESIVPWLKQQQQQQRDTESWNGIMSKLAVEGRSEQAQQVYDYVFRSHGTLANMHTFYQLMLAYINNGQYYDAMEIYYQIRDHEAAPSDNVKNLQLDDAMYNQLVQSLAEKSKTSEKKKTKGENQLDDNAVIYGTTVEDGDDYDELLENEDSQPELLAALSLLKDMRQLDMTPTNDMYISLLNAGSHHKDEFVIQRVHKLIRMDPFFDPDRRLYLALMEGYRSIGDPDTVMDLWDRHQQGLNVVIEACSQFNYQQRLQHVWQQCQKQFSQDQTNVLLETVARNNVEQAKKILKEAVENGNTTIDKSQAIISKYDI